MAATSIRPGSRPVARVRRHSVLHLRMPPACTLAAQCSAIITSIGRAMTTWVGRQSLSTRPWASSACRTAATVPGDPCSRNRRRQGSGHRGLAGCAGGTGTPGSSRASTPTDSRTSSSDGSATGSMGAMPNRGGESGQGSGMSTLPRPGATVASTWSTRPGWATPARGQVDPAYQLEVHAVGERPDDGPAAGSGLVAEPVPGSRAALAEMRGPGRDCLLVGDVAHQPRNQRVRRGRLMQALCRVSVP